MSRKPRSDSADRGRPPGTGRNSPHAPPASAERVHAPDPKTATETGAKAATADGGPISRIILPLALTQFIASFAASSMNVAISDIARDLGTDTRGVQTAITLFTLTMAAFMIPGSKLSDRWGRKKCLLLGLVIYGAGASLAALSDQLPTLIVGYSLLEGLGSALMIPPIYILLTVVFGDVESRAKAFGVVSASAGLGAAAGPLIGGLIISAINWRAVFVAQVLVVGGILLMSRKYPARPHDRSSAEFDIKGTILSAVGLVFLVLGILISGTYGWGRSREALEIGGVVLIPEGGISPVWPTMALGALILFGFFRHARASERKGEEPLIAPALFRNRVSNMGLVTQNVQWLIMQGSFFVISVFLQTARGYSAIETGLILTAATVGILTSSSVAGRLARRFSQVLLIRAGFAITILGIVLLLLLVDQTSAILTFVPGLLLMGIGIGVMLTSSVNVVQSAFPEERQGEISGVSRSVSNLGSALGTALVGSVLVSAAMPDTRVYGVALVLMAAVGIIGLLASLRIPKEALPAAES